jgi:ABC-type nitrate/sulfonate/bicarbonate transport system permease component
MYALVIVTGLLGVTVNVLARRLERWLLAWHPSIRGEVPG